ncbi:hypothetical protein GJ688_01870 [Heliobacillus mobilis]|uniref:Uncharacterized protein n=1 Tax=Heliobacterium mobile TaxID=28064 RepID=A0A6I3SCI6_HELMO|nr:hypothetical protein [Heliobacterium mobile]MTV47729.1 hypothetical protein [Heliobacterium mobile]
MWFKSEGHKSTYQKLMTKANRTTDDCFYASAIYLLSAIDHKDVSRFISPDEIDFTNLRQVCSPWSNSEKSLVYLANALFNNEQADVADCFRSLDSKNIAAALEALRMRYGG